MGLSWHPDTQEDGHRADEAEQRAPEPIRHPSRKAWLHDATIPPPHLRVKPKCDANISSIRYGPAVTCDFCRSPQARWRYPASARTWLACDKCHRAIAADDREALLSRVVMAARPEDTA